MYRGGAQHNIIL